MECGSARLYPTGMVEKFFDLDLLSLYNCQGEAVCTKGGFLPGYLYILEIGEGIDRP